MLYIVKERFLKCAQRHLDEAKIWMRISTEYREEGYLMCARYAGKKADEHLEMTRYWHMACNNLHYKPGTWAYKF